MHTRGAYWVRPTHLTYLANPCGIIGVRPTHLTYLLNPWENTVWAFVY